MATKSICPICRKESKKTKKKKALEVRLDHLRKVHKIDLIYDPVRLPSGRLSGRYRCRFCGSLVNVDTLKSLTHNHSAQTSKE